MKRFDHLYAELASFENLWLAERKAGRGKRGQSAVAAFEFDLEDNLWRLHEELVSQTYQPGPYTSFTIRDPKHRLISAAPYRDRVVHHALCNIIEPLFERTFIGDSYANRLGNGTHAALDRAQGFGRRYRYVLQCDIEQFFSERGSGAPARDPGAQDRRSPGDVAGGSDPGGRRGGIGK